MNKRFLKVRRVTITYVAKERDAVLKWLEKNDYRLMWSGPIRVHGIEADTSRLKIVAEKEVANKT